MNTPSWTVAALACACLGASLRADPLDDLIVKMKAGQPLADAATRDQIVQRGMAETHATYRLAMVNDYLAQVKASIIDEENHGGWPCRSTLVYTSTTRRTLTAGVKLLFDRQPSPIIAYAMICPALYAQDQALINRALAYLKTNDPFLHERAQLHMSQFWLPFISDVLRRQTPPAKSTKGAPSEKEDPLSVLPKLIR